MDQENISPLKNAKVQLCNFNHLLYYEKLLMLFIYYLKCGQLL